MAINYPAEVKPNLRFKSVYLPVLLLLIISVIILLAWLAWPMQNAVPSEWLMGSLFLTCTVFVIICQAFFTSYFRFEAKRQKVLSDLTRLKNDNEAFLKGESSGRRNIEDVLLKLSDSKPLKTNSQ